LFVLIFLLQERRGQHLRSILPLVLLGSMVRRAVVAVVAALPIRAEEQAPLEHRTLAVQAAEEAQHLLLAVLPQQTGEQEATDQPALLEMVNRVAEEEEGGRGAEA
jgi:hypothetical protein